MCSMAAPLLNSGHPSLPCTDGTLLATWAVPLEGTVASAQAGPTRFIYAIGPLSEQGVLASHARGGTYPYGDVSINLVAA